MREKNKQDYPKESPNRRFFGRVGYNDKILKIDMPKSLSSMVIGGIALLLVIGVLGNGNIQPKEQVATPSGILLEQEGTVVSKEATEPVSDASVPPTSLQEWVVNIGGGQEFARVTFVVDGDTVEIQTEERVRLIGIDSPERGDPYYTEARNKLSELVLNKQVRMEKDVSEKDRYGRLLRYLYVGNLFVNLEMVKQGYASAYTYPPDVKYSQQFLVAEQEARNKKVGLWVPAQPQPIQSGQGVLPTGFTVPSCAQTDCDCGDFSTHAYAQWFYETYDPSNRHRLDGDKDGEACESLP